MTISSTLLEILPHISTPIAAAVFASIRSKIGERGKSKNVEQGRLEQLSAFLAFDIKKREKLIVEQQFRTTFGILCEYKEILCMLSGRSPLKALTTMRTARGFVNFNPKEDVFQFKPSYATLKKRTLKKWGYFGAYAILVYAALSPWYFLKQSLLPWPSLILLLFPTAIFALMAWATLDHATDISSAERFIIATESPSAEDTQDSIAVPLTSFTRVNISIRQ